LNILGSNRKKEADLPLGYVEDWLSFGRGAQNTLKVVFLILKYYLGLALCIDSYVGGFFLPLLLRQFLSCTLLTTWVVCATSKVLF
jgi:hypothetical protein